MCLLLLVVEVTCIHLFSMLFVVFSRSFLLNSTIKRAIFFFVYCAVVAHVRYCSTFLIHSNLIEMLFFFWIILDCVNLFVINCNVVSTNRYFLTLICIFDNVACVSTTYRIRSDIIDFNVLLSVFNNAIDLYDLKFV